MTVTKERGRASEARMVSEETGKGAAAGTAVDGTRFTNKGNAGAE